MRQNKFRAYDRKNKTFFYVTFHPKSISWASPYFAKSSFLLGPHNEEEGISFDDIEGWQECIGLEDKNYNEIYEGDILGCSTSHNLEVYWMGLGWGVRWKDLGNDEESIIIDDGGDMEMEENVLKHLEIIGNIYENPELLTK